MSDDPIILSEEGRLRQKQILEAAMRAAVHRKRRASVKSGLGFCALVLTLWPIAYWAIRTAPVQQPTAIVQPVHTTQKTEPPMIVQRIETDPKILQRLSLPPITSTVRHIGDAELLRELADAHQPAGLITVDGKSRLVFH